MKVQVLDSDALRAVSPISLHAYLKAQGWARTEELPLRGVVYEKQHNEILAPAHGNIADYASVVGRILSVLEVDEARSQSAILRDLATSDSDLLRVRAPEAESDGSLPVEAGVELFKQSRDLLLAAACAAIRPQRLYRSGGNKEATEYLDTVRLGQTERGSFIVTLLSPVPPDLVHASQPALWPEMDSEPFGRRVTRRLSQALRAVGEAIGSVNSGADIEAFERRVDEGVSANLCGAVAKLIRGGEGIDISLTWAATRPAPESRAFVRFKSSDAPILEEATRVLTTRGARPNERIEGFVTKLAREPNSVEGRVTIKAIVDEKLSSVSVDLDRDQYSKAVSAHDERTLFLVEGDLERIGQRWTLKKPRHVEVQPSDPDEVE